jgi:hypothetical protein
MCEPRPSVSPRPKGGASAHAGLERGLRAPRRRARWPLISLARCGHDASTASPYVVYRITRLPPETLTEWIWGVSPGIFDAITDPMPFSKASRVAG